MSASIEGFGVNEANTYSTASVQTIYSQTMPENSAGRATVYAVARRVSDGASKTFTLELGYKRGTGDVTIFGLQLLSAKGTVGDLIALAAVSATVDEAEGDLRVRVSGLASTEIDWLITFVGEAVVHV